MLDFILAFQSTRPVRGATNTAQIKMLEGGFQSTRPVRGATRQTDRMTMPRRVSIHAPRAGRDQREYAFAHYDLCFNPRAPCGARQVIYRAQGFRPVFQSTRPVRGATLGGMIGSGIAEFQSTRPVRGATQPITNNATWAWFQSTRPVRGATEFLQK